MRETDRINPTIRAFIEKQPLFFVATAPQKGSVNVSPKGMDALRVLGENHVQWLSVTGSGNETSAHVQENGRMTLMFCAFEGQAQIVRLYGKASVLHPFDVEWHEAVAAYPDYAGARQIFNLKVERVTSSCGTGVPVMEFKHHRHEEELLPFYEEMEDEELKAYWERKNTKTIDGKPTGIFGTSTEDEGDNG